MDKLKVLAVGDLVVPTGFSTVMHNIFLPNLDDLNVTGLGVNYKGDPHTLGFPVFPAGVSGNLYGLDRLCDLLNLNKFDVLFILNDAWVISYYLDAIKKNVKKELPKIVVYFPIDAKYHNPEWYRDFDMVSRIVTYTEFGREEVKRILPDREVEIMPHGTDLNSFFNVGSRAEARVALFGDRVWKMGNPETMFVVLNANRNQPRKKLDITIEGFSLFAKDKPKDVKLYMHCGVRDAYIDIPYIASRYGVDDRLILTNLNPGVQKLPIPKLNLVYNSCDVGINTSLGEGWGLTATEHGVVGAPQLVPDHSSCRELFSDCGVLLRTTQDWTFQDSQTVGRLVSPESVAEGLQLLYENKEYREGLSKKTVAKFTGEEYQWQNIAKKWKDIFLEVCK